MNLFDVYSIFPINIVRGSGCYVYDDNGNSYLDLMIIRMLSVCMFLT